MAEQPIWGGRFSAGPDARMLDLTASIGVDVRLLQQDLAVTSAHAGALASAGILDARAAEAVRGECEKLAVEAQEGSLSAEGDEDVHGFVERLLTERLGDVGASIHAGRSRNDLVATDLRLWCKEAGFACAHRTGALVAALTDVAGNHLETVMPGYTHMQRAQPISLAFHLAAHGFALGRDGARFLAVADASDASPLGAGALAGTTLPIDARVAADELGFGSVFANAMDAVSDRDFACEFLFAISLCGVHLSRLAEEIVLWTSSEFGFARLSDEWSTGSSMMPQKRNPDLAELIRGRAAGGIGDLNGMLVLLKGLPLAYDRDLQEDKTFLFTSFDRISGCLDGMTQLVGALHFDAGSLASAARGGTMWATDAAEALVTRGVPFRHAHQQVGALVADLDREGSPSQAEALVGASFNDPAVGMRARSSHGGTAPERVTEQLEDLRAQARALLAVL